MPTIPKPRRGRPPIPGGPSVLIPLRLPPDVLAAVDAAIAQTRETRAGFVRRLIAEGMLRREGQRMGIIPGRAR